MASKFYRRLIDEQLFKQLQGLQPQNIIPDIDYHSVPSDDSFKASANFSSSESSKSSNDGAFKKFS